MRADTVGHGQEAARSAPWRVFLSHTADLRDEPADRSFVAAAEAAVSRAGHAVTDMAYFTARDREPADHCERMVAEADIFVGIIGARYGTPVRGRPEQSHTELEFDIATERGLPRLVFLIDEVPGARSADDQPSGHAARQAAFRRRLRDEAGVMVAHVATPADLEIKLYQALVEHQPRSLPGWRPAAPVDEWCPYPGLAPFQAEDARWFHGRDALTATLLNRVTTCLARQSLVLVVGASGAGKSSLLNAGLIPAVQSGLSDEPASRSWLVIRLTPGHGPLQQLAVHLGTAARLPAGMVEADLRADPARFAAIVRQALLTRSEDGHRPHPRLLLVVDQFEELFTQTHSDDSEVALFIRALCAAATPNGGPPPAVVVLGLRADYYPHCTAFPELVTLMQENQVVVGPMSSDELRRAIEQPAEAAGLTLQPGLVETILNDLGISERPGDREGYDPGRLPLLSHVLRATWEQRREGILDLSGYHAAGRIERAVTTTADRMFEGLTAADQSLARRLLLRMVVVEEGAEDRRRQVSRKELLRARTPSDPGSLDRVLNALVDARLVTATEGGFEIIHDALLHAWPRLQAWIDEDRRWLIARRRLGVAAETWEAAGRDPAELLSPTRLAQVLESVDESRRADLDLLAAEFLTASEERLARQRRIARHRWRGLIALAGVLAALLALSGTLALVAVQQRDDADGLRRSADSRELATRADTLRTTDPTTSMLLDVLAYRIAPTTEARSSLLSTQSPYYSAVPVGTGGPVNGVAVSADGRTVAAATQDGTVDLLPIGSRQGSTRLGGRHDPVYGVAFSPDGSLVAAARQDGSTDVWDIARRTEAAIPATGFFPVNAVAFSPDGQTIATAGDDGVVRLRDARTRVQRHELRGPLGPIDAIAFSPDGHLVAGAGADTTIALWDVVTGSELARLGNQGAQSRSVRSLVFSPDGRTLAAGADAGSVQMWDVPSREVRAQLGRATAGPVRGLAFTPDGRFLAIGGARGLVQLWDPTSGEAPARLAGPAGDILGLTFGPDGTLISANANSTVGFWSIGSSSLLADRSVPESAAAIALAPDRRSLAVAAAAPHTVRLWDVGVSPPAAVGVAAVEVPASPSGPTTNFGMAFDPAGHVLAGPAADGGGIWLWDTRARAPLPGLPGGPTDAVAFSPDGRFLAAGAGDGTVQLWSVLTRLRVPTVSHPLGAVSAIAFSPAGDTMAIASNDDTILLSNTTGAEITTLAGHLRSVDAIAFSPDGRTLASGDADGIVRLWDVRSGRPTGLLSGHTGAIVSVAFSPDGRTLATSSVDQTIRLWSVATGSSLATLHASGDVAPAVFTSSTTLVGADREGRALSWSIDPGRVRAGICMGRPALTEAQWQQLVPSDQLHSTIC